MKVKLTKLSINEGKHSRVGVGASITGTLWTRAGTIYDFVQPKALDKVKEGLEIVVVKGGDYLKTSPIEEVVSVSDNEVVFTTETSNYKLEIAEGASHEKQD